eukprot:Nitzschia sp. Nitz4//NODE_540_length_12935_cov_73.125932//9866//11602//NITZ4_additional_000079-RA//1//CDS//3329531966//281//frame0
MGNKTYLNLVTGLILSGVTLAAIDPDCGLWLGPSPIKEQEEHGFGLGMFTGRFIPKGTLTHSELFIPVPDFEDEDHPPLREYVSPSYAYKNLVLETNDNMFHFVPGLASIAPCTSTNYSLEFFNNFTFDHAGVHRSKDATVGSFTYLHLGMFRAVRDIMPGEELTVQCEDDDFDAHTHSQSILGNVDGSITCLDDKLEERQSKISGVGRGVFAKKALSKGSVLLSSPSVPIHKDNLIMDLQPPAKQLLWNYCFGHTDSDLLWLPYGPLINSVNHRPPHQKANVKVQWHKDPKFSNNDLSRRQQYHHPELLEYSVEQVSETHGKGLVMDLVALTDIQEGDEVYLDYGDAWDKAWKTHNASWIQYISKYTDTADYVDATVYNAYHAGDPVRTVTEQHHNPYPPNLITACRFGGDWIEDEFAENYDMVQYQSWNTQSDHVSCMLPCLILERDDIENGNTLYTAKLVDQHYENESVEYDCHIFRRFEYIYTDIPRYGIEFVNKEYASDAFLQAAFRHHIEVPDGMYPDQWVKRKLRKRLSSPTVVTPEQKKNDLEFRRRDVSRIISKDDLERKKNVLPRTEL